MKKTITAGLAALLTLMLVSACATRKEMIYLQDMEETIDYPVNPNYEAKIQADDKLKIVVTSRNPELALAFNLPGYGGYSVSDDGNVTATSTPGANVRDMGYLVDPNGDIDFPVLGRLHVIGLTRSQLCTMIKEQLQQQQLLSDAVVFVDFMNFKYSVLGEVGGVGTFSLKDGDRITILEALAQAGDLQPTSRIDRVAVIRDVGSKRRIMHVNLRSKDIFLSPAYYLQQNDIIYVEPNEMRAQQETRQKWSFWMSGLSLLSSLASIVLLVTKL